MDALVKKIGRIADFYHIKRGPIISSNYFTYGIVKKIKIYSICYIKI